MKPSEVAALYSIPKRNSFNTAWRTRAWYWFSLWTQGYRAFNIKEWSGGGGYNTGSILNSVVEGYIKDENNIILTRMWSVSR